ncbi:MAG: hypothetical protein HY581_12765 [Nitrospirae bacterium]|nr:hypothetical protein [Nitrospirota bacterium]
MKPVSEHAVGMWIPIEPSLESVLARLEALSLEPTFAMQRQIALGRALRPYADYAQTLPLAPFPEEVALATLYLYADYYPEDGQLSLIEQLRDVITVHVPEEERAWLDPLHHSNMDLLEILSIDIQNTEGGLALRSLGDGQAIRAASGGFARGFKPGQVLLTRLLRRPGHPSPDRAVFAGTAVTLSASMARSVYQATNEWRRELEAESGSFDLGQWEEFAKRYGHILLWNLAQARLGALLEAESGIRYHTTTGEPFLYALTLYDHHEFRFLADGLCQMEGLQVEPPVPGVRPDRQGRQAEMTDSVRSWVQRGNGSTGPASPVVARLTLTPTQLVVECDSRERLDGLKHLLASTFGYSLHFRGESTAVPPHELPEVDVAAEDVTPLTIVVTAEEEHRLLSAFLESVYLEWADQPSPGLGGQTPRHAMGRPDGRARVAALINQLERDDLGRRRIGKPGYDYNRLRAHVGL